MTVEELLSLIVQFSAEQYLRRPVRVRIDLDGGEKISLPVPQSIPTPPTGDDGGEPQTTEVEQAIFNKLADTCKRQTREQMAQALNEEFSESVVHKALWKLRQSGRLTNSKDAYGLGFGLPEWS